jgi:hypothetical protein
LILQRLRAHNLHVPISASIDKLRNLSVRGRRIPLDRDINYQFATRLAHAAAINSPIFGGGGRKFRDVPLMKILVFLGRHEMRAPLIFYSLCVSRLPRFQSRSWTICHSGGAASGIFLPLHAVIGGKLAAGRAL